VITATKMKNETARTTRLTTGEVARIFDVQPATIRRWCELGKIKACPVDRRGHRGFKREDVAVAYLDRSFRQYIREKTARHH